MKIVIAAVIFLFLIILNLNLIAQTTGENENSIENEIISEENVSKSSNGSEDSQSTDNEDPVGTDLIEKTLPLDISVSSYYDLLAWCRRLELDESGTKESLQQRLYNHYSVSPPVDESRKESGDLLELEDSNRLDYKTIDDRTNITFTGEVELTFTEDSGTVHRISADILDFNQDEQIITAYGNVRYELEKKDDESPEIFRGNSLTFDIESWAGLFFKGLSERDTTIKDEQSNEVIKFYYYGDVIYRSSGDTVILTDGTITTCDIPDPHLEIKAGKIWVLAPGEWAIYDGFFYVGRVPMFYIPGFLKNGDPMFFNPTVGFASDAGYIFQTTTYLLGEKEKKEEDSIIDFMQVGGDEDIDREIEGLFLRESDGLNSFQLKTRDFEEKTDSLLKLMVDYYSYLGVFTGITGSLNKLGPVSKLEIYIGAAKSREVYASGNAYTPLYKNDDGEYTSNWENGFFLNYEIPFRFAFDVNLSLSIGKFSMGMDLPVYSDPYFLVDFDNRKEDIELDQFADFSSDEDDPRRTSTSSLISSQKWELKTSFKPSTGILAPYLNTASINRLNFSMTWSKKNISQEFIDSSIESFLFPSGLNFLDYSINLSGKIHDDSGIDESEEADGEKIEAGLVSPWEESAEEVDEEEDESEEHLLIQDSFTDVSEKHISDIEWYSHNISWSLRPDGNIYGKFDDTEWERPEDIDYQTEYQVFRGNGSGNIVYKSDVIDDLLSVSNTLDVTAKYNNYFYRGDGLNDVEWQNFQDQANALNNLKLNNNLSLTLLPLHSSEILNNSAFKYNLKTNVFLWDWATDLNEYSTDFLEWDEDSVLTHSMSFDIKGELFNENQTLNLNIDLPPDNMEYSTSLNLLTGPLKSVLNVKIKESTDSRGEKKWIKQPITLDESLRLNEFFSIGERLTYEWEDEIWGSSITSADLTLYDDKIKVNGKLSLDLDEMYAESTELSLNLWNFTAKFNIKRQYPYDFSLEEGWQIESGSNEKFLPDHISFSYNHDVLDRYYWKNRINMNTKINSSWNMDLVQFTDSNFTLDLTFNLSIHDFMTLSFTSTSKNNATFRYFPGMAETIGVDVINPLTDLFKSFNFFNRQHRVQSNFNLNSLKLSMTHNLHDWDLVLELEGNPEVRESGDYNVYEWVSKFSIFVNWKAWSDLEAKIDIDDNEIVF